jgi:hypothetical protein
MQLSFEVYRHLSEVPEIWKDSVKPDSGLSPQQLQIFEQAGLTHLRFFYVITKLQHEAILISYYQHLSVTPDHFNCRDKPFQHHSLNVALRTVKPTLLVVGNLFRHDTPFQQFIGFKRCTCLLGATYFKGSVVQTNGRGCEHGI